MRAPFQVLIVPYVKGENKFLIFKRKDFQIWQFISGGGEDSETPVEAMKREVKEETGLKYFKTLRLSSLTTIPVAYVGDIVCEEVMIPEIAFSIVIDKEAVGKITLSPEHSEYRMVSYDEANKLLRYDSNKSALWEFCHRLNNRNQHKIIGNINSVADRYNV